MADPEAPNSAPLIVELSNIRKSYSGSEVLADVSLPGPRGEIVCIIVPLGEGGSTRLRCIYHFERIDDGTITFEEQPFFHYQALRIIVLSIRSLFVSSSGNSARVLLLTLRDFMFSGQLLASSTFKHLEMFAMVAVFLISYPSAKFV